MPESKILSSIQEHAVRRLSSARFNTTNLSVLQTPLKEGSKIHAHRKEIPVPRESYMIFADDAPLFNWSHPCRYLLYDARNGELYRQVEADFPPYMTATPRAFKAFHEPVRVPLDQPVYTLKPFLRCPVRLMKGVRYAILFSGASNNRHTNDLEFLYRTLRDIYNFAETNIYCLNYDGSINYSGGPKPVTNWPGNSTAYRMPLKGAGTKDALEAVIDELKGRIKADDLLFIHTNNHGGWDGPGRAYLCTYSGPDYYAADFAAKLAELPAFDRLMVMMEQCHSGGFNGPIIDHSPAATTTVASACVEANNSIGGSQFDPFARDWIAAMAGHTPYGGALAFDPDTSGNGKVSASEAFHYADTVHNPSDTPNYDENSVAAGNMHLGRHYHYWWWYCPIFVEILQEHYIKLPIPEFYAKLHSLAPQLEELAVSMDQASDELRKKVGQKLRDLVGRTF